MQELANVKIKTNQFGSTVTRSNVTPIELLFLAASHHERVGGDPIVDVQVIPATEEQDLVALHAELSALQVKADANNSDESILAELKTQRAQSLIHSIKAVQDKINEKEAMKRVRALLPHQEQQRLAFRYGEPRVTRLFATNVPQTLSTFDQLNGQNKQVKLSFSGFVGENTMFVSGDVAAVA